METEDPGPDDAVVSLSGVGPARQAALAHAGITRLRDLVAFFPTRHQRRPAAIPIGQLQAGPDVTVVGTIRSGSRRKSRRRGQGHYKAVIEDETGQVSATFFNQGWLASRLTKGTSVLATGSFDDERGLVVRGHVIDPDADAGATEAWEPVYPTVEGIKPRSLVTLIRDAVERSMPSVVDPLPASIIAARRLAPLADALRAHHGAPASEAALAARRRRRYDGFLAAILERAPRPATAADHAAIPTSDQVASRIADRFPFALTPGQSRAIAEIRSDLAAPLPMRRLVQGDVGSGKTAVAAAAIFSVLAARRQVAVLAPTEPLARQLAAVLGGFMHSRAEPPALLCGSLPAAERRRVVDGLAAGDIRLVVGTHALLAERASIPEMGLAVVDEQHKFGVQQRRRLVEKGTDTNLLVMSATPIPRSLALALYSDLDHSVIAEGPRGRLPVETRVHAIDRDGDVDWSAIASRAREGCPTFIVFPAIESVEGGRPSVLGEGRRVARRYFRKIPVAALHGRLEHAEKTRVLNEFRTGVVKVLFCTTILEVGIDVPDATDVVIVGAECFGLSQLHQIRGRVGRGGAQGRCLLVSGGKKAALDRLEPLAATSDGFQIAELDLETRGPGDMMGLRQHGFGALPRDEAEAELLAGAVEDARLLGVDEASRGALSRSLRAWWDARDVEMTEPGQAG